MKSIGILIFVLALLVLAGLSFAANTVAETHQITATQEQTVADIIMESRRTPSAPPPDRQNGFALGAGLLAIVIVIFACVVFFMFGGARFLREFRLARKRPTQRVPLPQSPPMYVEPGRPALRAPYTPELPELTGPQNDETYRSNFRH